MNTIFIHDFRVETRIGVYAAERQVPQALRFDIEIGLPSSRPFETGDLADAIDYAAVVSRLREFAAVHPYTLLESFAEAMATIIIDGFGAQSVRLRVAKLAILPGVREIGVAIERHAPKVSGPSCAMLEGVRQDRDAESIFR